MRDDVTETGMLGQLRRLANAFGKPFGIQIERQGEEFTRAFRRAGLPATALDAAVDESISSGKRFPSVAELLGRARDHVPQTDAERNGACDLDRCPVCRERYFYAGYELPAIAPRGRVQFSRRAQVVAKVRCACPQQDLAWYTEAAWEWREAEPNKFAERLAPSDYPANPRYRVGETPRHATARSDPPAPVTETLSLLGV